MTEPARSARPIKVGPVLRNAGLAGLLAAALNSALYLTLRGAFSSAFFGSPDHPMKFTVVVVVVVSLLGSIAAGLFYLVLRRLTRHANRVFLWTALLILLASLLTPLTLKTASETVRLSLLVMHVMTAAAVIWLVPLRSKAPTTL